MNPAIEKKKMIGTNGTDYFFNNLRIGRVLENQFLGTEINVECFLPGVKPAKAVFERIEQAESWVEHTIDLWLKVAGIEKKRTDELMSRLLKEFYAREINLAIASFFDSGWMVQIGDTTNGFKEQETFDNVAGMEVWLQSYLAKLPPLTESEKFYMEKKTAKGGG